MSCFGFMACSFTSVLRGFQGWFKPKVSCKLVHFSFFFFSCSFYLFLFHVLFLFTPLWSLYLLSNSFFSSLQWKIPFLARKTINHFVKSLRCGGTIQRSKVGLVLCFFISLNWSSQISLVTKKIQSNQSTKLRNEHVFGDTFSHVEAMLKNIIPIFMI